MLKNPCYYGHYTVNQFVYEDGPKGAGTKRTKKRKPESEAITFPIPAIISKVEYDIIQETVKFHKIQTKRTGEHTLKFFLCNVIVCGRCGGLMNAHLGSKRKDGSYNRYYTCYWAGTSKKNLEGNRDQKCTLPYIKAEKIENAVWTDVMMMFALNPKHAFESIFDTEKHAERILELEQSTIRFKTEFNNNKRIRERLFKLLTYDDMDTNELLGKLRQDKDESLTIEGHLIDAKNKLQELRLLQTRDKETYEFLTKNKKEFGKLRKEIRNLSMADRKLLVEGMLTKQIQVNFQEDSEEDGPGGVHEDFQLHINPEIIQCFIDERKLHQLNINSWKSIG